MELIAGILIGWATGLLGLWLAGLWMLRDEPRGHL